MKAPHHSTQRFFAKAEVKERLLNPFFIVTDFSSLKIGKLSGSSHQKNPSYRLPLEGDPAVEHGFVENFCQLFEFRD